MADFTDRRSILPAEGRYHTPVGCISLRKCSHHLQRVHFDPSSIDNIKNDNTIIVIPNDNEILNNINFDQEHILIVEPNKDYEINNIKFSTIPSYNTNKSFHLKEYNWVGYIINIDNKKIYIDS